MSKPSQILTDSFKQQDTNSKERLRGSNTTTNYTPTANPSTGYQESRAVCPVHRYIDEGMERIENKVDTIDGKVDNISLELAKDTGYQEGKFNFKGWAFNNLSRIVNAILIFLVVGVIAYYTVL